MIEAIILKGEQTDYAKERFCIHWALKYMNKNRNITVSNRTMIDQEESSKLYQTLVIPAIQKLEGRGIKEPWDD